MAQQVDGPVVRGRLSLPKTGATCLWSIPSSVAMSHLLSMTQPLRKPLKDITSRYCKQIQEQLAQPSERLTY